MFLSSSMKVDFSQGNQKGSFGVFSLKKEITQSYGLFQDFEFLMNMDA